LLVSHRDSSRLDDQGELGVDGGGLLGGLGLSGGGSHCEDLRFCLFQGEESGDEKALEDLLVRYYQGRRWVEMDRMS